LIGNDEKQAYGRLYWSGHAKQVEVAIIEAEYSPISVDGVNVRIGDKLPHSVWYNFELGTVTTANDHQLYAGVHEKCALKLRDRTDQTNHEHVTTLRDHRRLSHAVLHSRLDEFTRLRLTNQNATRLWHESAADLGASVFDQKTQLDPAVGVPMDFSTLVLYVAYQSSELSPTISVSRTVGSY